MFIMSLAVADLIVGIVVMPISSFDFIADGGQGELNWMKVKSKSYNRILHSQLIFQGPKASILFK